MPKVTPISEIADLEADSIVYAVNGKITTIYEYSNGENSHGEWSFQTIVLKDKSGEIKVKLKNRPALAKLDKGKEVEILSVHSDKHGWVGVKAVDDEYKTKITRILMVTGTAELNFIEDSPRQPASRPATAPRDEAPAERPPQGDDRPPAQPEGGAGGLAAARHFFMQCSNTYSLAFDAALYTAKQIEAKSGLGLEISEVKEIATAFFIQFSKEQDLAAMPARPLPAAKPKPSAQPAPPAPTGPPFQPKPPAPKAKPPVDEETDDIPF